ncbi:MAG: TOBE domain-containing protein [Alphaproteobacteria bacterium]|nr:TOBE domain-containing protein [Alphaproteobacteria bacterium]
MRFELRRLHDEYRYTTVYVTHDQVEAMTTADRIVVMNAGRIEQAGTPEDVYERPESEFVARFIGGTNILRGQRLDDRHIRIGGVALRVGQGALGRADAGTVSARFHDIRLLGTPPRDAIENLAAVDIRRRVFLGASRDYFVVLDDGTQLRVTTPPELDLSPGTRAWIQLPPEKCRGLER